MPLFPQNGGLWIPAIFEPVVLTRVAGEFVWFRSVRRAPRQSGMGQILSSHEAEAVPEVGDQVACCYDGGWDEFQLPTLYMCKVIPEPWPAALPPPDAIPQLRPCCWVIRWWCGGPEQPVGDRPGVATSSGTV